MGDDKLAFVLLLQTHSFFTSKLNVAIKVVHGQKRNDSVAIWHKVKSTQLLAWVHILTYVKLISSYGCFNFNRIDEHYLLIDCRE